MHGTIGNASVRVHRVIRRSNDWTLKEHEVVVSYWPDMGAIAERLPHRSNTAIRAFAGRCNLTSNRHVWTAAQDNKLRKLVAAGFQRKEIAAELGLSIQQIGGRLSYCKIHTARRPPAPSENALVHSIRQRAFELNMSLADLDRSLGTRKIFRQAAGRQRVGHTHIERAVKALGGNLVVEWTKQ
ncbi:hypothetical protein ACVCNR_11185 [Aquamicrobium terrae]